MKRNMMKRIAALMLAIAMVLSLSACSSGKSEGQQEETATAVQETKEKELVPISFYSTIAMESIDGFPWIKDFLAEEFGIKIEEKINTGDGNTMSALLASGELPDLVCFNDLSDIQAAVDGGMLLNLDDYKDQLPSIFGTEDYEIALNWKRELNNGLYVVPVEIGEGYGVNPDPQLRWDLYEKLGTPVIEDYDQLLEVLQDMVELEPVNREGYDVYGLTLWSDWDIYWMASNVYGYMGPHGYECEYVSYLTESKVDGSGVPTSILADDSVYKDGLEWLFKANQMGLIDPDAPTMGWDAYCSKMTNGQVVSWNWNWWPYGDDTSENYYGMASVWTEDTETKEVTSNVAGHAKGWSFGISSQCKNLDKVLEFLDWLYSEEGKLMQFRGPEGIAWEMKDGKAVYTEEYLERYKEGKAGDYFEMPGGGKIYWAWLNTCPVDKYSTIEEATGQPYHLDYMDTAALEAVKVDTIQESWKEVYGEYRDMYSAEMANGGKHVAEFSPVYNFVETIPDDIQVISKKIGEIIVQNSWKMVYAKDQAEFDQLWEQTKADAESLGIDQVVEDAVVRWNKAVETAKSMGLE